jgi:prephenate dehydrogenase
VTRRPIFERLAVVGLGLVGGSVALAARERGAAGEVRGVDPALTRADDIPLVPLAEAAAWADALVLAVPPFALEGVLESLAPVLSPEAVVTDTASIKGFMSRLAHKHLPRPERVIGAHPMAGGDESGFPYARANLFEGAPCILTPAGSEPPEVVDRVEQFWQCLGTFTVRMGPEQHDAITAVLSHAPHVIAFAFARGLPEGDQLRLAGQGLRDFVRIARANPRLWCEILLMNRQRVTEELSRFEKHLGGIQEALARGDRDALEQALRLGQRAAQRLER